MPGPSLGAGQTYNIPPESIRITNPDLYNYLYMLHVHLFGTGTNGKGDLDAVNISVATLGLHGTTGTHSLIVQGAALVDAPAEAQGGTLTMTITKLNDLLALLRTAKVIAT